MSGAMDVVTRFAPSPTGALHLGHARAALFAHGLARRLGGCFLVRVEDLDASRCRPEFETQALDDLAWLGLGWDLPVRRQSAHMAEYRAVLDALRARGLLYPCFCTRAGIAREVAASGHAPHDPDGAPLYPGTCRALPSEIGEARIARGDPHAWRLDMARAVEEAGALSLDLLDGRRRPCDPARFGDVVLGRKDVPASYHLAVTHDDALQRVTLVTRGEDLAAAADLHRLLQALMGWAAPLYAFHPLIMGPDGRRLAKRDGAASLAALRARGMTAAEIIRLASVDALIDDATLHPFRR